MTLVVVLVAEIGLQHVLRVEVDASADLGRVCAEDPDAATLVAALR